MRRNAQNTSCSSILDATIWGGSASTGQSSVPQYMGLERYSHVMHLVSRVEGRAVAGSPIGSMRLTACFPAGNVSLARRRFGRWRSSQSWSRTDPRDLCRRRWIRRLRSGHLDCCITIRTIAMRDGKAYCSSWRRHRGGFRSGGGVSGNTRQGVGTDPCPRDGAERDEGPHGRRLTSDEDHAAGHRQLRFVHLQPGPVPG